MSSGVELGFRVVRLCARGMRDWRLLFPGSCRCLWRAGGRVKDRAPPGRGGAAKRSGYPSTRIHGHLRSGRAPEPGPDPAPRGADVSRVNAAISRAALMITMLAPACSGPDPDAAPGRGQSVQRLAPAILIALPSRASLCH